ncbi:hypothetical protein N5J43_05545 [Pseudomonas nicosulfuronedens]|uniref:Lipoprotein n=1 Tax=Pseudomonas nicosulfuronedens TaxID=2571105 RepID=A0A5R9RBW2_9PSED|nr:MULTISPECIES: hypothetical protein [Pseudomonas]MDH1007894.1 hypothetical protein [Pseudomonas nicosulfuronedens]MDH1978404.1 hypothetical protein [Pseudomonas nicosulfuronedens]MDH2025005.1 hypothetical protein [Pseudomonas nicosulfuronedens]TLX80751.1 hypothetical protein FAS41_03640 [Pseudomonas nicosulfuronedens]
MAPRAVLVLLCATLLAGCETTHETLLAQGYPPAYADGYDDGCGSGRQAAGAITGEFRKNVPRYLGEPQYALGWNDGFQQCQAMRVSQERQQYEEQRNSDRDRDWEQQKDRALSHALRGN